MSVVTVSSGDALVQALSVAKDGDVIQMAAGSYTGVEIWNIHCAGNITVTSADPTNQAVFGNLSINQCSGLTFTGLTVSTDASAFPGLTAAQAADVNPFRVQNCDNITLTHLDVHGKLDNDPSNDRNGLLVNGSTNITVTQNEFHEVGYGVITSWGSNINITDNYIHDIRLDAIHGSSSNTLVANNFITNMKPVAGDHSDIVQWFAESTTIGPHDLTVTGNVYIRGDGGAAEGIFICNQTGVDPELDNFNISDNLLIGNSYLGIMMQHGVNLTMSNNALYSFADYETRIWLGSSTNVVQTDNIARYFVYGTDFTNFDPMNTDTNIIATNNVQPPSTITDGGAAVLAAWLAAHPAFFANNLAAGSTAGTAGTAGTGGGTPAAAPAPALTPAGLTLDASTDTGVVGDNITRSTVVRIDGSHADAGATITLISDGAVVGAAVADANGVFSVVSSVNLTDGSHTLQAVAQSAAGAVSSASDALHITVDTAGGVSDLLDFTLARGARTETVGLSGNASDPTGSPVSVGLYRDGTLVQSASSSGTWSFSDTTNTAVHTYTVKTTDVAGNVTNAGHSLVIGTSSAETLKGTAGADLIWGAGGYDTMTGGAGADTFIFRNAADAPMAAYNKGGKMTAVETITDFTTGDKIDLSGVGHLVFDGQSSIAHTRAVDWYISGNNTFVIADTTGDGRADMMIQLSGVHHLTASDFLLG